jgi:uncharacterized protein (TIGR03437 family)
MLRVVIALQGLWLTLLLLSVLASAQSVTFTEYPLGTAMSQPSGIAAGPDGALWFTESGANQIGRITTAGTITEYRVPTAASEPTGITKGPDGALWFAEYGAKKIGRVTVAGVVTEYPVPTTNGQPAYSAFGIATGPDGALWFLQSVGSGLAVPGGIGRITTGGAVVEYPTPTFNSDPCGITTGPDGALWFTEYLVGKIGRITTSGIITEYPSPTVNGLCGITAGPDGALWFAENVGNIGRISTAGVITEYSIPNEYSGPNGLSMPAGITAGPDGALWFTDPGTGNIGRSSTAGVIIEYPVPTTNGQPVGIATGPDGALWFTESSANKIGRAALSLASEEPSVTSGGIVPVDSTVNTIQSGEWVSIYGTNLASSTVTWNGTFPTSLGGTSVTINGKAAYLSFVSPMQINVQAPDDTAIGSVPVVVTTAGGTVTSTVTLAQFAPSFLLLDSKHVAGIILRSDGSGAYGGGTYDILGPTGNSLGYATVAAKAGDTVELFALGLGPTDPAVPAGQAFSGAAPTTNPINLLINNASATPFFAGLSGAGLYQIDLTVPGGLGAGDVSLVATVGGLQTQTDVVISLQ